MSSVIDRIGAYLDGLSGLQGTLGYIVIVLIAFLGHAWINSKQTMAGATSASSKKEAHDDEQEEEPEPPRNFTAKQLRYFDGTKDEKTEQDKPVYLSLNGTVFDVSSGRDFYGPEGPYALFAGRECGAALAKMSFDETFLDSVSACKDLNFGEKNELDNWMEKFKYYRCYPVMGKLIPDDTLPSPDRVVSKEELARNDGAQDIPEGYGAAPIYIGAGTRIFDASFGGVGFYGKGCSYNLFAGKNASRALAKMSFNLEDIENSDTDDLTEKERKILNDWIKTFEERKGYPCVGRIEK